MRKKNEQENHFVVVCKLDQKQWGCVLSPIKGTKAPVSTLHISPQPNDGSRSKTHTRTAETYDHWDHGIRNRIVYPERSFLQGVANSCHHCFTHSPCTPGNASLLKKLLEAQRKAEIQDLSYSECSSYRSLIFWKLKNMEFCLFYQVSQIVERAEDWSAFLDKALHSALPESLFPLLWMYAKNMFSHIPSCITVAIASWNVHCTLSCTDWCENHLTCEKSLDSRKLRFQNNVLFEQMGPQHAGWQIW